jgi:protein-L-isoaspartate(D-aspartate) O-methyltransferase
MDEPEYEDKQDAFALQQALVEHLKKSNNITIPAVEAAFRAVPRHLFLPDVPLEEAYNDQAIATKFYNGTAISSSSQPAVMAIMLEQLQLEPGHRVLEIGAGTGYNAALMAHIVGESGQVITIDIDDDTVAGARAHLASANFNSVQVICSDGGFGYPEAAPFDRIILTVGVRDIAPAWYEQLAPSGRLLLPLGIKDAQVSVAFEWVDDHLESLSVKACGFMALRGAFASPIFHSQIGPQEGLYLALSDYRPLNTDAIYQLLIGPSRDLPTHLQVIAHDLFFGLSLWLDLYDQHVCRMTAQGAPAEQGVLPDLYHFATKNPFLSTIGLLGESETSLCLLMRSPDAKTEADSAEDAPPNQENPSQPFELFVRSYGPDDTLAQRLIEQITAWDATGRPGEAKLGLRNKALHIKAYPHNTPYLPSEDELVIPKRWVQLVISWQ